MPKVGDHDVSPYLTQRLRSIEEVQAERERRRGQLGGDRPAAHDPPPKQLQPPKPPATEPAASNDKPANRPGRFFDKLI